MPPIFCVVQSLYLAEFVNSSTWGVGALLWKFVCNSSFFLIVILDILLINILLRRLCIQLSLLLDANDLGLQHLRGSNIAANEKRH
jgi:hypothetical protein